MSLVTIFLFFILIPFFFQVLIPILSYNWNLNQLFFSLFKTTKIITLFRLGYHLHLKYKDLGTYLA